MSKSTKFTAAELLAKAEDLLERSEHETALKFLQRAVQQEPDNVAVLDTLGEVMLELGRPEDALQHAFTRSVTLAPAASPSVWMYLGQLQAGAAAVHSFQTGIDLMLAHKAQLSKSKAHKKEAAAIDQQISTAYCSMAELYTTDLCEETDAESRCEQLLQSALSSCPTNPQGYIALCNLRLIQQRHAEARAALQQALSLFEASSLASVAAGGEEEEDQDIMGSFELRLEAAKMCLECALYEQCATIAERLLQVNDTELQLWYLAGMAYARQAPPQPEEAVEYLSYTLKELEKTGEDPSLEAEVRDTLTSMQALAQQQPAVAEQEDQSDDEEQME